MWQPSASREALLARQRLYQTIRTYFSQRDVVEVETLTCPSRRYAIRISNLCVSNLGGWRPEH